MKNSIYKIRKTIVVILLTLCFIIEAIPVNSSTYKPHGYAGPHVYWQFNPSTKTLLFYGHGRMTSADEMDSVDILYEDWYHHPDYKKYWSKINTVIFSEGITEAGFASCYCMENLTKVVFSKSITAIRGEAFNNCYKLKHVDLPPNLKIIEKQAFANTRIKEIKIPEGVTKIEEDAFENTGIRKINFPKSLKELPPTLYYNQKWIQTYQVPSHIESIGNDCFCVCKNLKAIKFNKRLRKIGNFAFKYCKNLKNIKLPSELEEIGEFAFGTCGLTSVVIPKNVKKLKQGAFSNCQELRKAVIRSDHITKLVQTFEMNRNLEKVVLPKKLKVLGDYVFCDCRKLESVEIPNTVKTLGISVFENCTSLKTVKLPDKITEISDDLFTKSGIETITVPSKVTVIGIRAFKDCKNLKEIRIESEIIEKTWDNTFSGLPSDCIIYAPESKIELYRNMFQYSDLDPNIQILPLESSNQG